MDAWFDDGFLAPLMLTPGGDPIVEHWVRQARVQPGELPISATYREREGGRRYCFHLRGYVGPRVLSKRRFRQLPHQDRLLLAAIPRAVRSAFRAPAGRRYLVLDIDRCFLVLLATVAGDTALLEAAGRDLHQEAGDTMAPQLPRCARRQVGKLFNNAVIGLISPSGWRRELANRGLAVTVDQATRMHARWWGRFTEARRFRDDWIDLHRSAAARTRPLAIRYPDSRLYRFDADTVRGQAPRPAWVGLSPSRRLEAAIRTSFSAIWRGVEGVILDQALRRLFARRSAGLRLVLPTYDGLLLEVDAGSDGIDRDAQSDLGCALDAVGVPAGVSAELATNWAGHLGDTPDPAVTRPSATSR